MKRNTAQWGEFCIKGNPDLPSVAAADGHQHAAAVQVLLVHAVFPPPFLQAFYKSARVEYVPVGVVGAIVPWNWPFHNIINPISAAVMAGNAIVVKVGTLRCCDCLETP